MRRVVAYAVSDRVLATRDGRYLARLELRFVTRVFLTREIEHRRRKNAAGGGFLRFSTEPARPTAPAPAAGGDSASPAAAAVNQMSSATEAAAAGTAPSATSSLFRGDGTEIALREVFQRPVAFGYRAITIALPPSTPAQEATP